MDLRNSTPQSVELENLKAEILKSYSQDMLTTKFAERLDEIFEAITALHEAQIEACLPGEQIGTANMLNTHTAYRLGYNTAIKDFNQRRNELKGSR